jgi:prepilin-type N-terminal cleavage/methylation domain-containing protein
MQLPSYKSIMKKGSPASAGYTLIEILIVFVIVGILFTLGYNNFQDYSRQQTLLSVIRSIQTDIRSAQESAIAGNKPVGCSVLLNGYQFIVTSANTYEIDANCTTNKIQTKIITLPAGITIGNPNPNPIIFKSLAQGTNIRQNAAALIVITQVSTGKTRTVTVGANGNVQ